MNSSGGLIETLGAIEDSSVQIQVGKYLFLASFTILLWDHACTLSEEVHGVWKKRKTYVLCIFLFIRYYAPLAVTVVLYGYFSTSITRSKCAKWMYFLPFGVTIPLTISAGMLMMFRVWALYNRNKYIILVLSSFLVVQTGLGAWQWALHGGAPAPDPLDNYEYHFCIYLPPEARRNSTIFLFMELAFDTLVFVLTISRTTYMHITNLAATMGERSSGLIDNLIRDGALYWAAIFSVNLAWVIMILHAPTALRAIFAVPSSCITTVLISRVTLNLRTTVYGPARVSHRTYKDIVLSNFETKSDIEPRPTLSLPVPPHSFGRCLTSPDNGEQVKSELMWASGIESLDSEGYVRTSESLQSSDEKKDKDCHCGDSDGVHLKEYLGNMVSDHNMVREVPRGRFVGDGRG